VYISYVLKSTLYFFNEIFVLIKKKKKKNYIGEEKLTLCSILLILKRKIMFVRTRKADIFDTQELPV
jgi:hypothetical protein